MSQKMNGFQFGSSICVKLCEIIVDEKSVVTGKRIGKELNLSISDGIIYLQDETSIEVEFKMDDFYCMPLTKMLLAFYPKINENSNQSKSFGILFENEKDLHIFRSSLSQSTDFNFSCSSRTKQLNSRKRKCILEEKDKQSEFDSRTEEGSANQYFQFYGSLFQQQNMMQDYNRTATYQRAINDNYLDFKDKIILDVGAGSGILSFFATQAGARRIYAVEASSMVNHCKTLVSANGLDEIIKVIPGKIEEIELPEQVDVIISEPMGYMLVNERMLESYVYARKYLRKGGRMYPSQATLHIALFNDEQIYIEQITRSSFWAQEFFHGVNLSSLKNAALDEVFHQPIVDSWHIGILVSKSISWSINFEKDNVDSLHRIEIPFEFKVLRTGYVHGIATWFDVGFFGQKKIIWLSTAPTEPLTHWYQVRCLLKVPMFAIEGQLVKGKLLMVANEKQSYDLELEIETDGLRQANTFDLKMPHFRYNGQPIAQPPGNSIENPSEQLNLNFMTQMNSSQSHTTKNFEYSDFLTNSTNITNGNNEK